MDISKLKNVVILVLVIVNLFLLSVVLLDSNERGRSERAAQQAAVEVLEQNGVSVDDKIDLDQSAPVGCTYVRDDAAEAKIVRRLLGDSGRSDLGGNIIYYSSENGQANLRGTGELDAIFSSGYIGTKSGIIKTAQKVISGMGIETAKCEKKSDDSVIVTCAQNGIPVYNAQTQMNFSDSSLMLLTGVRVFDTLAEVSDESGMDSLSVLMRFVEIVREKGYICSMLTELSPGYLMNVEVSGEAVLTPVWHIVTDTGEMYINAVSGREESVANTDLL